MNITEVIARKPMVLCCGGSQLCCTVVIHKIELCMMQSSKKDKGKVH